MFVRLPFKGFYEGTIRLGGGCSVKGSMYPNTVDDRELGYIPDYR